MNLGDLISELEKLPPDLIFKDGFGDPKSYRGYYDQIAFEPKANVSAAEMLTSAKSAIGAIFHGYKGGEYMMSAHTPVNIAEWGVWGGDDDALTSWRWKYMLTNTVNAENAA